MTPFPVYQDKCAAHPFVSCREQRALLTRCPPWRGRKSLRHCLTSRCPPRGSPAPAGLRRPIRSVPLSPPNRLASWPEAQLFEPRQKHQSQLRLFLRPLESVRRGRYRPSLVSPHLGVSAAV